MNMQKLFLGLLLWIVPLTLFAQRTVSGRITDAEFGDPIPGVSVFIANTTVGMTTDSAGYYRLMIPGDGRYRLTAAHAAYQSAFIDIDPGQKSVMIDIKMQIRELNEVTVAKKIKFRSEDINLFWETILGKSPTKGGLYATNPQAPYYFYDSEKNKLTVSCREPLNIINNETGYSILYVLKNFTHNYNTNTTFWKGEYMFVELKPKSFKELNTWENNRKKVYSVSITHFIRSLYCDSLIENGFSLFKVEDGATFYNFGGCRIIGGSRKMKVFTPLSSADREKFLYNYEPKSYKILHIPAYREIMLVCFGKPGKKQKSEIISNSARLQSFGLFRSEFNTNGDSIRIFPDGTFENQIYFSPDKYISKSLTGLNMTLPIEYNPGSDVFQIKTILKTEY